MIVSAQYKLHAADLEVVLALVRGATLAAAADLLGLDASTVFRSLQRIEKGLGQRLFERSRSGYLPLELANALARHAEQVETELEAARSAAQADPEQVSGAVRITTTDTLLHGLVLPTLAALRTRHPLLQYELHAGNELANLTRREADIALRATNKPPPYLVGKHVGPIRAALFGKKKLARAARDNWIAPDDAMPDHPSVLWRRKHLPRVSPAYRVNSILTVAAMVEQGLGVGILPLFLARARPGLEQLGEVLDECQSELWLLTHTESRHLRRVSAVFGYLAESLVLD